MGCRFAAGVEPLTTKVGTWADRNDSASAAWVSRNWVKMATPPSVRLKGGSKSHFFFQLGSSGARSLQA